MQVGVGLVLANRYFLTSEVGQGPVAVVWSAYDRIKDEQVALKLLNASMREVIGRSNLQYAQTEGRSRIEQDTKELLQRILDEYGLGVRISNIQLLRVDPPQEVIAAFRDVQAARADKEKSINEANTYRNQVLPRAQGEAESIIQKAEGYKAQKVASAKGDVQRFTQIYDQYAKAKDITSERLYLDTMALKRWVTPVAPASNRAIACS